MQEKNVPVAETVARDGVNHDLARSDLTKLGEESIEASVGQVSGEILDEDIGSVHASARKRGDVVGAREARGGSEGGRRRDGSRREGRRGRTRGRCGRGRTKLGGGDGGRRAIRERVRRGSRSSNGAVGGRGRVGRGRGGRWRNTKANKAVLESVHGRRGVARRGADLIVRIALVGQDFSSSWRGGRGIASSSTGSDSLGALFRRASHVGSLFLLVCMLYSCIRRIHLHFWLLRVCMTRMYGLLEIKHAPSVDFRSESQNEVLPNSFRLRGF